jgi:hypothetical protein
VDRSARSPFRRMQRKQHLDRHIYTL